MLVRNRSSLRRFTYRQQTQGFPDVPACDVEVVLERMLDGLRQHLDSRRRIRRAPENEPDVVVRIRRGKSPRPASGFAGVENFDAVAPLKTPEQGGYGWMFGHGQYGEEGQTLILLASQGKKKTVEDNLPPD